MARRKAGTLLPLELRILEAGLDLQRGEGSFHGFLLAAQISRLDDGAPGRPLTAHGTLYKALARMTEGGLLSAEWEDPAIAERAGRPRRRLYTVTPDGAVALAAVRAAAPSTAPSVAAAATQRLA
jgi:DNA-binding PadR family transcriptional regulator